MTPIVAIVGRPNVGKSTLFNRLVGRRLAIVDDAPGVTRDRHYADAYLHGRELVLVDTGGFDPGSDDPMGESIARQVQVAIEESDAVLCLLDGSMPATGPDREAVELLRRSGKPVVYVANKVDGQKQAAEMADLYTLGLPGLIAVSALHGRGTGEVASALVSLLPPAAAEPPPSPADGAPRVALVGRPNAGKSSLFNRLSGSERSLVDHRPGTTRDPVDSEVDFDGRHYLLVDTAGIRRRSRVKKGVEAVSVMRAIRAVDRAQVVVLMCDATIGLAEQDARLLGLCAERGRAVVVALNKIDRMVKREVREAEAAARRGLHFASWTPLVPISALSGTGVKRLMSTVWHAALEFERRVPTAELNRFFSEVIERHPPPTSGGRAPRIYYVTQAATAPPVFVAVCSAPSHLRASYKRYLSNQIRAAFGFESIPVRMHFKQRASRSQ